MGCQQSVASGPAWRRGKRITVENPDGTTVQLDVTGISNVGDAKRCFERLTGVPAYEQQWFVDSEELHNSCDVPRFPQAQSITLKHVRRTPKNSLLPTLWDQIGDRKTPFKTGRSNQDVSLKTGTDYRKAAAAAKRLPGKDLRREHNYYKEGTNIHSVWLSERPTEGSFGDALSGRSFEGSFCSMSSGRSFEGSFEAMCKDKPHCQCPYHNPYDREVEQADFGPTRNWCQACDQQQTINNLIATGWI